MRPFDPVLGLMFLAGLAALGLLWLVTVFVWVPVVRAATSLNRPSAGS